MNARTRGLGIAVLLLLLLAAVFAVMVDRDEETLPPMAGDTVPALQVAADVIDPANEGKHIGISGVLSASSPAVDEQLGIQADAIVLLRHVQMLQWHEQCADGHCEYTQQWSSLPLDSSVFQQPEGHQNPDMMPFVSARFDADEIRLGAFVVDAALATRDLHALAWPVRLEQLPENLAASFREQGGVLFSGDAFSPQVGDLRVSYEIMAGAEVRLSGIQHGNRLQAPHATVQP